MSSQLAPGFLVASPSLLDPSFQRSVVLLIDHQAEGSLGFVINRPSDLDLRALANGLEIDEQEVRGTGPIMLGGPVAPETGWIVFDRRKHSDAPAEGLIAVSEDVSVSTSKAFLIQLVRGAVHGSPMLVLGYAGWGPGQLDAELAQGAWIPVDLRANVVFETPFEERWGAALRSAGIDPARLTVQAPSEA